MGINDTILQPGNGTRPVSKTSLSSTRPAGCTTIMSTEQSIHWLDWGDTAFQRALSEEKPVLLALTATWCHWCHVMDQTSYSHPEVIDLVDSRFVPVRVDVDQRPDLSHRYNQGGFPSVAVLDHQGELITGRIYTPPEEMVQFLERVSSRFPETDEADRKG